ncbi:MAG: orotidine-5'-phosphate decarboxylase, partial [Actinobacteria bacterium]
FYEAGPEVVAHLRDMGFKVFIDLKLHDIPHQVEGAAERLGRLGAGMITVHASGGAAMVSAARRGAAAGAQAAGLPAPTLLAVTVLTSMNDEMLAAVGVDRPAAEQVELLARGADAGGADGVVCSPHEAARMRVLLGEGAAIVTPGVRPGWAETGDQQRIATPASALEAGASHLVVGRPITAAAVPADAAKKILDEMEGALA